MDNIQNTCRNDISEVAFNALADSLEYISTKIKLFELKNLDENLENVPKREIVSQLATFKNSFYYVSSVYLALENGQYYESSSQSSDSLGVENQEWYYETRRTLKTSFLAATKNNKANCGIIASPFYYNGKYAGVIAAEVDNALLKKIADYFDDDVVQIEICDKNNNSLFLYDKNFVDSEKYIKQSNVYKFVTHNTKEISEFHVSTYVLRTGSKPAFIISTWLFSLVFIFLIGVTILLKWRNNKDLSAGVFGMQIIIIMMAEITSCFIYYYISYVDHIDHHENVIEKYSDQIESNAKYTAETIWFKVQENNILKENKLLDLNSPEMNKMMEIFNSASKMNRHCVNLFFISKDGEYQNYPYNPNYEAKDYNFQINRRLLNGSDRSTYLETQDLGYWFLKEYVFKVKDDRNNVIGTFGVNLDYEVMDEQISRFFGDNRKENALEYRGGVLSKTDSNGEKIFIDSTLTNDQIKEIDENEYGITSMRKGWIRSYYAYYSSLKDETKCFIPITLEPDNRMLILLTLCIILSLIGLGLAFYLAIKEKTDTITFENVEDDYEVDLMKKEDSFYEMIKNDEEVEKGLKIMKLFGKKASNSFQKKINDYKKRKEERDRIDF